MINIEKGIGRDYFIRLFSKITIFIGIDSKEWHKSLKRQFKITLLDELKEMVSFELFNYISINIARLNIKVYRSAT
jgi:hypothetical protein